MDEGEGIYEENDKRTYKKYKQERTDIKKEQINNILYIYILKSINKGIIINKLNLQYIK